MLVTMPTTGRGIADLGRCPLDPGVSRPNGHIHKWIDPISLLPEVLLACEFLFHGSAMAFMLKEGIGWSGLKETVETKEFADQILKYTHENMSNLDTVVCMGRVAARCATRVFYSDQRGDKNEFRDCAEIKDGIHFVHVKHPSRPNKKSDKQWQKIQRILQRKR